ncbi:MAG TPA: hypothetical protein PK294_10610 [Ignavibacteria bacterium]|nr:hypothetical protein [Ignavibacteria bacterium]HQY53099.1 hypothetical protein [Ignavibacteria bacterium]HRB00876.1 hypothetical protein [Ignavibacteria bacterium]
MKTQSKDTSPEFEKILIEKLRKKSTAENLRTALSLSSLTIQLSKRAILRANPGKSKRALDLIFVEAHYGKKHADKLEEYLNKIGDESK